MFIDVVKKLAEKKGMSMIELQRKAGIPKGGVYKWNTFTPSLKSLNKLAKALGVTPSYLLRLLEEDKERSN